MRLEMRWRKNCPAKRYKSSEMLVPRSSFDCPLESTGRAADWAVAFVSHLHGQQYDNDRSFLQSTCNGFQKPFFGQCQARANTS